MVDCSISTSSVHSGQIQANSTCEFPQQSVLQPPDVQTDSSNKDDTTSVLSATCTRTRTVKTPKQYDV